MIKLRGRTRLATNRGYLLITSITFIGITSVLLAGVGSLAASHQTLAESDADWAKALDIAEAGVNTELSKISRNPLQADQYPGATYSFGGGTYTVWVVRRNHDGTESTPWTPPNDMYVYSQGTCDGVTRTVKVSVKAHSNPNRYAIFGMNRVTVEGSVTVDGLVGTNGTIEQFGVSASLLSGVELCGHSATAINVPLMSQTTQPQPRYWQTVDEIAWDLYPQGGLDYLRTHNDNARAGLPTSGDTANIVSPITLVGPGDYYVRSIQLSGNNRITFNNTAGPVRLWIGKTDYTGLSYFSGTTSAVPTASNQVDIYCASTGGVEVAGTAAIRCNLYAYNLDSNGTAYGNVTIRGNPQVYGTVLGSNVYLRGNAGALVDETGTNPTGHIGYYGFDNSWAEGSVDPSGRWSEGSR